MADNVIKAAGSGAMNTTLSNAAAADQGHNGDYQIVRLPIAADVFDAESTVYIEGSTNYDGMRYITSTTAGYIDIRVPEGYTAETFAGTETVKVAFRTNGRSRFKGFELAINSAASTSENFTVDKDANAGSDYDVNYYTEDLSSTGATDLVEMYEKPPILETLDVVRFAWSNSDSKTWGLKMIYEEVGP